MDKKKLRKWILIGELIFTIIMIYRPVLLAQFHHELFGEPRVMNGTIDLADYAPTNNQLILDGEWQFFWKQFIISDRKQTVDEHQIFGEDSISDADIFINVPDDWSNYKIDGERLPAGGYGSYRLILKDLNYDAPITIFISDFGAAYRVFIDGQLTASSGVVSNNMDLVFTTPKPELFPVTLSNLDSHEVVVEVATTRFSGLYMTPSLYDYQYITWGRDVRNSIRMILFGIALFAFICLVTMYIFFIRQKRYFFWMPVLVLFVLVRMMLTAEMYSFWQQLLFFNLSYERTNEMMYFVTFTLKFLFIFLIQEQCGILFSRKEKMGFFFFYCLLYLVYLFVPQNIYNYYLSVFVPALTFTIDIYLFVKVYQWRDKLSSYGMTAFLGEYLLVIGLSVNSYYINGKIFHNMSLSLLIFFTFFLINMLWLYAMRMGDFYDDFTVSASRLEMAEKQITMQKEYYDTLGRQMNEIREIKHDINHFTGTMRQLADDGNFEKLRSFLNEYCEKAKMDQLPIFCEHTICNSVIGYYYLRAKEYGISFTSHCHISEEIGMRDSDLCIVFGNALDNAINACKHMDQAESGFISIETETMKGQRLIKVTNSYQGQLIFKNEKYISSKSGNSHGYGIKNMTKVVEAYGGFVKIEHKEGLFAFMAAIPE